MRTFLKILVPLALVLPLGAFVAGSLVASASDDPPVRDTIVIRESNATPGTPTPVPGDDPTRDPGDDPDDTGGEDDGDDVETVGIEPDDVRDDSDGRHDDYPGDIDDDSSGPGGGGDDSSGHGSGGDSGDRDDNSGPGGGDD